MGRVMPLSPSPRPPRLRMSAYPPPADGTGRPSSGPARALHLRPGLILLVALGGTAGTAAREALSLALPPVGGVPTTILGINLLGAFLLGFLLDALARRGPDAGGRRGLRLLLGTGFLGGFTTHSALAADSAVLLGGSAIGPGLAYALGTVLVGAFATGAGVAAASVVRPRADGHGRTGDRRDDRHGGHHHGGGRNGSR